MKSIKKVLELEDTSSGAIESVVVPKIKKVQKNHFFSGYSKKYTILQIVML